MTAAIRLSERRTSVDEVFDHLHAEILSLSLKPGDRLSEAEVAAQFGISRQPVRDAFSRLANLDLLLIRPQRATVVRGFSQREISKSRFVRAAVEREVLRLAALRCTDAHHTLLKEQLELQHAAQQANDFARFGKLDYAFHHMLCEIAQAEFAFDVIQFEKSKVDRLCVLGLAKEDRMPGLIDDHQRIADAVMTHDDAGAIEAGMKHLGRLDETIESIIQSNANFFEP